MKALSKPIFTLYAPAARASETILFQQLKSIAEQDIISKLLGAVHDMVAILNQERQIVYANQHLLDWLELENTEQVCSLRFGEAMQCVHVREMEGGCGTSTNCRSCGALRAILNSQKGESDMAKLCRCK